MDYRTIRQEASDEFTERRSRFIGTARPVQHEAEATEWIAGLRQKYWDASHNVYAYILREGNLRRYSDDGEPQGTAGLPVLDVLQKEGLCDLCVVVTRYFGGILLGGGGLVRAYSHSAKLAVDAAGIKTMRPCAVLELDCDYSLYGKISYLLPQFGVKTLGSDFGAAVHLRLLIAAGRKEGFVKQLQELSSDTVHPYLVEECFAELD
ncbi:IMPACT family protein [Harryflintia acetispora]|uniref:YigZ family protein n=1 Tax=Harryflintia acetispora TaxID=1849041 RepID=A0A9X8ULP1_9FIRM|nr:YigZ family protein [Harryflintia acetispora]TCL45421.1 putative YigZ family protein [Harryflintia acetispora]